jgi:hypothetical protein
MPEYTYGGTLTFNSNMEMEDKFKIIEMFPQIISGQLYHTLNSEYYLRYTIEYHKVDHQPDPEAPHVHFIILSNRGLHNTRVRSIRLTLDEIGRSQFYRMTRLKYQSYLNYIQKEVEWNDAHFNRYHDFELRLEKPEQDPYYELDTLIDTRDGYISDN